MIQRLGKLTVDFNLNFGNLGLVVNLDKLDLLASPAGNLLGHGPGHVLLPGPSMRDMYIVAQPHTQYSALS